MSFSASAVRLAGVASVVLGWRPEEFWRATPEELATVFAAMTGERDVPPDAAAMARLMAQFPDLSPSPRT